MGTETIVRCLKQQGAEDGEECLLGLEEVVDLFREGNTMAANVNQSSLPMNFWIPILT